MRRVPGFRTPYEVVEAFLGHLGAAGLLERRRKRWHPTDEAFRRVGRHREAEQAAATRREQLTAVVSHILDSVPGDERRGFVLADWLNAPQEVVGMSPSEAIREDDEGRVLLAAVTGLKLMLLSNGPPVQDQLGLPVGAACERERGRRTEEAAAAVEARRLAALAAAEAERQAARHAAARRAGRLNDAASATLGPDAATWLDTVHAAAGPTHDRLARRDEAGLAEALEALRGVCAERERLAGIEALRELLRGRARTGPNPDRGHLFLTSGNPRFRNLRPIDFCSDERSFSLVSVALAAAMTNSR